jgi:non-specific serine/threonine protein kinase
VPLPAPLTSFVGRVREVQAVADLLRRPGARLVTLTGPGGVGKTRLALQAALHVAADFADGVRFVPLAPIRDPELVAPAIAEALGVLDSADHSLPERLRAVLASQNLLLVLDNVEQVAAASPLVGDFLAACPRLKVLATSRLPLHVAGEQQLPVPPLPLPELAGSVSPEQAARSPAVRLFVERAQAVKPDFALTAANAPAVAEICRRLDGLPLAIELAAARCKVLSAPALLALLTDRFRVLAGGPREAPDRLRTLREAVAWSYDLLAPEEQALFRRLAVFVGGFQLDAAEAVAIAPEDLSIDALEALSALVDHSLLQAEEGPAGEPRFTMLETIRAYGGERLAASGEAAATQAAHAAQMLNLAERAGDAVALPGGERWLTRLTAEQDNLRAALGWLEATGDAEGFVRLAGALRFFWFIRGHFHEGNGWLERALARGTAAPAAVRARALYGLGLLTTWRSDDRPVALFDESLALWRTLGDQHGTATALHGLGMVAMHRGDQDRAERHFAEALALARELDETLVAGTLAGVALQSLGCVAYARGQTASAVALFEEALDRDRALAFGWQAIYALIGLAFVSLDANDPTRSLDRFREALDLAWAYGDRRALVSVLAGTAAVAAAAGQPERAARLFGAVESLREAVGMPAAAVFAPFRVAAERGTATARAALQGTAFAAAWTAGRALPLEQAVTEAAEIAAPPSGPVAVSPVAARCGLTERELEVLSLLVEGRSDREIAAALFISPRTAQGHVAHIFTKLNVSTRSAAVATAFQAGLVPDRPALS